MPAALISGRRRGLVIVTCPDCGASRTIRADSATGPLKRCRRCGARPGGVAPKPSRVTGQTTPCEWCASPFWQHKSEPDHRFCSKGCFDASRLVYPREHATCPNCGRAFERHDKPHSNSAGRFCSRKCYGDSLAGQFQGRPAYDGPIARPGWKKISLQFRAAGFDACFTCGTTAGRIGVHHVDPFRFCRHHHWTNLVTACYECHGKLEILSYRLLTLPPDRRRRAAARLHARIVRRAVTAGWISPASASQICSSIPTTPACTASRTTAPSSIA
jgi:hypothetical protein